MEHLTNTDIFFFRSNDRQLRDDQAIVGYSENGQDCLMYLELGITIQGIGLSTNRRRTLFVRYW